MKEYEEWHESLKHLIKHADPNIVPRSLYMLPIDFRWPTRPGLTLIGDAAKLMTPFSGAGVNFAMLDALELSRAITGFIKGLHSSSTLTDLTKGYEEKMIGRRHNAMKETWHNLEILFKEDAPKELVEKFEEMMKVYEGLLGSTNAPNIPNH